MRPLDSLFTISIFPVGNSYYLFTITSNIPRVPYITLLRFPLAVLVVLIHALNGPWRSYFELPGHELCSEVAEALSHIVPAFAVPLFFAISGFLFFRGVKGWNREVYVAKLHRRVRTLLIPYLTWNLIAALLFTLQGGLSGNWAAVSWSPDILWGYRLMGGVHDNALGMELQATSGPILEQLWFVRDLIVISLLTPLLHLLWRRLHWGGLLLIGLVYYLQLWPNFGGISFKGLWFFALGAWLSLSTGNYLVATRGLRMIAACSALFFGLVLSLSYELSGPLRSICLELYILCAMATAVLWADRWAQLHRVNQALASSSFFLYASHTIVLLPLAEVATKLLAGAPFALQLAGYLLCPTLAILICYATFRLLRRYFPRWSSPLTGIWNRRQLG